MHKRLKQILLIISLTVALAIPSVSAKADDAGDVSGSHGWYHRYWGVITDQGIMNYANSNTNAYQDDDYFYYNNYGHETSYNPQYETIGSKLSYNGYYIYIGGDSSISEDISHRQIGSDDYVSHKISLDSALSAMPQLKSDLMKFHSVTVQFDPVYGTFLSASGNLAGHGAGQYGKIYNYGQTNGAPNTVDNNSDAQNIPTDFGYNYSTWSDYARNELKNSFKRILTLSIPPHYMTSPENIGIISAESTQSGSDAFGDYTNVSYRKRVDGSVDLSQIWVKSKSDVDITVSGKANLVPKTGVPDGSNAICSTFTNLQSASNPNDSSEMRLNTDQTNSITNSISSSFSTDNRFMWGGNTPDNYNYENSKTRINFSNSNDAYTLRMQELSYYGATSERSNSLSTIYTDDNGPTWTDPAIDSKGYSSNPTIEFADVQDAKVYGGNDGVGLAGMTYKMYSNDTEKARATDNILFKMVKPVSGDAPAYVDSSTEAINSSGLDPAYTGSSVLVDFSKFKDKNITLEVTAYDWLGNQTTRTYTITKSNPEVTTSVSLNKTWQYAEPNSNVKWYSEFGNPALTAYSKVDSSFGVIPDTNDLKLVNEADSSKVFEDLGTASSDSPKTKNFFTPAQDGYSGVAITDSLESTSYLFSNFKYSPNDNLDNTLWDPKASGKVSYNGKDYTSPEVGESEGNVIGIDEQAPVNSSADWCASDKVTFTTEDQASGLDRVDLVINGQVTNSIKLSNDSTKVTRVVKKDYSFQLNPSDWDSAKLLAYDNVGHVTTMSIPEPPSLQTTLTANSVQNSAGKYVLRVNATGVGKNPVDGDMGNFVFNYLADGHKVDGQSSDSFADSVKGSLDYSVDVPDDINTTDAPTASIDSADHPSTLSWTSLDDVQMPYHFKVYGSSSGAPEDAQQELKTISNDSSNFSTSKVNDISHLDSPFNFCSGFGSYQIAVYYEGATQDSSISTSYSSKKMVSGDSPYQSTNPSLNVSNLSEGWYYARIWMIDKNGNPSGVGTYEWHQPPTFVAQIGLKVTAVKDVNWEKENYPFIYTEAGKPSGGPVTVTKGKDYDKFSLGSNYKPSADKDAVHNGYIVNYRINRDVTNVKSINIKYEFTDSSGNPLTMSFTDSSGNSRPLEQYDSSEHTNYVSQVIDSPSDLAQMNPGTDGLLLKHQVPSGTRATVQGTNADYNGDVLVTAVFTVTSNDGVTSPAGTEVKVPLYTMSMQTSAEDDVTLNPVR